MKEITVFGETHKYKILGASLEDTVHVYDMRVIQFHQDVQFTRQELLNEIFRYTRSIDDLAGQGVTMIILVFRLVLGQVYLNGRRSKN